MLKQVVLTAKRASLAAMLEKLRGKDTEFEQRKADMAKRESELEAAVQEVTEETGEDEKAALDSAVAEFEGEQKTLEDEAEANETEKGELERQIAEIDRELAEINARTDAAEKKKPEHNDTEKRKDDAFMNKRSFFGMTAETRDAFMARDDVKDFLLRVREIGKEKRAVTGKELLIPTIMLDILRQQIGEYSKLISRVNLRAVGGKARQRIAGNVPEAVWTEMCAKLNELTLAFNEVDVDGYKVGGFIPICNAVLEDNDINLAQEIITALGAAIGRALDKAILYGTGVKMPLGIVTRLAQQSQPADYPSYAPTWTDLHSTNVITINADNSAGLKLFQNLIGAASATSNPYATGMRFWAMNEYTHMQLMQQALNINAMGSIVADGLNQMPVVGGDIVILPDSIISNNNIVAGYGDLYLLAERAGTAIASSEEVHFIEDETVFKGTARYDGMPVIADGFVAIGINNTSPSTTAVFAADAANTVATPTLMPGTGTFTTSTMVFISCETPGAKIYYTNDGSAPDNTDTEYDGPITLTATKTIKAIAYKTGLTTSAVASATYTKS